MDEAQRVPDIFLPIKQQVDEQRVPGTFLLTGSANPFFIPRLGDSLAGRMEIFELFPLSQSEIEGVPKSCIDIFFAGQLPACKKQMSRSELYELIGKGGYPTVQAFDSDERESWFHAYVTTLLQRDVKDISNITGIADLPRLLHLLAARSGSMVNMAELSRSSGISATTLNRILRCLKLFF